MYPRARLDALSDAVFGVAMTLLVLDVRLPEEFQPRDAQDLLQALHGLAPKFLPYVLSFWVLGLRWLSNIQVRSHGEVVGREYARWWLLYLLLITCVPFTTIIVGRFGNLAPAIWVYAGNTILISAVAFRLMALTPDIEPGDHLHERRRVARAADGVVHTRHRLELRRRTPGVMGTDAQPRRSGDRALGAQIELTRCRRTAAVRLRPALFRRPWQSGSFAGVPWRAAAVPGSRSK